MVDRFGFSDVNSSSLSGSTSFGFGSSGITRSIIQFPVLSLLRSPLSAVLEYSGIGIPPVRVGAESLVSSGNSVEFATRLPDSPVVGGSINNGEVSITIIGSHEDGSGGSFNEDVEEMGCDSLTDIAEDDEGEDQDLLLMGASSSSSNLENVANGVPGNDGGRDSNYQRYDLQLVWRWIEQILPFVLLLLVVFIRQHLQGFIVSLSMAGLMFKSNNIIRKQTALKGDRKNWFLVTMSVVFMLYVFAVYWLYRE
ncbi:hypothetical protein MLD38_008816 [Melastoma candidum]|uniref:Uncharacterized protein n=1 Tax=Melastoma candidum TaxID=119954 RepID=A0ACB9RWV9_9MYRT|nr:hypothetical protein MLD38_008816 [Melastoma candidum]